MEHHAIVKAPRVGELPVPMDLDYDQENMPFHRISVAYGLSLMPELPRLPGDMPAREPPPPRRDDHEYDAFGYLSRIEG